MMFAMNDGFSSLFFLKLKATIDWYASPLRQPLLREHNSQMHHFSDKTDGLNDDWCWLALN